MVDSSRARVLVVEDEWEIADFVVKGLREEGFSVEHAPDGLVGMRQIDTQTWDIILLDWGLPGESGMSLLKRLRSRGLKTPVIFLTARDAVPDRVKGLEAGADDYLCKPFAFEELLARVRALIRRQTGEDGAATLGRAD